MWSAFISIRPRKAIILCVDEKPSIQALERAQGYLKLPNGRALTGQSHDYKRHGTTTLFAALEVATGRIIAAHCHLTAPPSRPSSSCRNTSMLSSPLTTKQPSHSPGPRKKSISGGSKIAVSLNSDLRH